MEFGFDLVADEDVVVWLFDDGADKTEVTGDANLGMLVAIMRTTVQIEGYLQPR